MTGWAMLGLEAAGRNPLDLSARPLAGRLPAPQLRGDSSTGDLARTILALRAPG